MIAAFLARLGLSQRVAGVLAYVLPALALALLCGLLWLWIDSREAKDDRANVEVGRTIEREAAQSATIEQVEAGNAVRIEVEREAARGTGGALFAECLRAQRGAPEACQRYAVPE